MGSNVNNVSHKNDDTNDTCDADRTIIDIIKENMVNEKEYNAEIIKILKEQVGYFKNEIIHQNTLIGNLIIEINACNNDLPPNYQMSEDKTNSQCETTSLNSDNTTVITTQRRSKSMQL